MAQKLFIAEYSGLAPAVDGKLMPVPQEPALATQVLDYSGGVQTSVAFNAGTTLVKIESDSACYVLFGTAPTAVSATSPRLPADRARFHGVPKGGALKVSVVA